MSLCRLWHTANVFDVVLALVLVMELVTATCVPCTTHHSPGIPQSNTVGVCVSTPRLHTAAPPTVALDIALYTSYQVKLVSMVGMCCVVIALTGVLVYCTLRMTHGPTAHGARSFPITPNFDAPPNQPPL